MASNHSYHSAHSLADLMDEEDLELISEFTVEDFERELKKYPKVRDRNYQGSTDTTKSIANTKVLTHLFLQDLLLTFSFY